MKGGKRSHQEDTRGVPEFDTIHLDTKRFCIGLNCGSKLGNGSKSPHSFGTPMEVQYLGAQELSAKHKEQYVQGQNLVPVLPKICQRCLAGDAGHFKHILI